VTRTPAAGSPAAGFVFGYTARVLPVVVVLLVGLAVGSFLNVVIARIPERRSLLHPPSACPGCGSPIAWRDNIPLVSFVALRGRCRACGMAIPWTYPLVEAGTAAGFGIAFMRFGAGWDFAVGAVLISTLIAITVIDLRHQLIPDAITLPGILAGLLANVGTGRMPWTEPVIGVVVGGGLFFVVIVASGGGMGGGDMKLGAMLGAFLGWKVMLVALFVGVLLGGCLAVLLIVSGRRGRKDPIPFGPFLAAGGVAGLLYGERIVGWYVGGFGG
jgi:leader peptidase (prepilin peptidase)/N-methyltransferase